MAIRIDDFAQKQRWERKSVNCSLGPVEGYNTNYYPMDFSMGASSYLFTQADFAAEKHPSAHRINSADYRSNRPLYKWDEASQQNVFNGFEPVERVTIAMQKAILRHKTTHCFGEPVWFGNEGRLTDTEKVDLFKSYWNSAGMNNAMVEFGESCFGTGDGALCLYKNPQGELRYQVFSYDKGDLIVEFLNPDDKFRRNVLRKYIEHGNEVIEIYRTTDVQKWSKGNLLDPRLKIWYQKIVGSRSEDDYVLISQLPHGLTQCPVVYHREPDVCWGDVQGNIEDIEKLLSDLMENGKYYNFQILFLSGKLSGLPPIGYQGKVIAATNPDADAKILQPADASNTFTLSLKHSFEMLCYGVGARFVSPEDLKGGDYSGAYLRNLYFTEAQWATQAYARFNTPIKDLISIFKEFVGVIEKDATYSKLRISHVLTPFVPSNLTEEIQNINASFAAGTISRQTASEENPIAAADEKARLEVDDERKKLAEEEAMKAEQEVDPVPQPEVNPQDNRFVNR
jgi:hypothetical protein